MENCQQCWYAYKGFATHCGSCECCPKPQPTSDDDSSNVGLVSDDRHHVLKGCPIETELYPLAGQAEVILGDVNGHRSAVRLVFEDVDTAHRVMEAARHARNVLAAYLYGDDADEAAEPTVGKPEDVEGISAWFETDDEAPTVDEPSRDRSQPADSPPGKVVRRLTSV